MKQPAATSPGSIMPGYPWLYDARLDTSHIEGKIITLRRLGVPYPEGFERQAEGHLKAQASAIAAGLARGGFDAPADREIVALIAYMQRLGTDITSRPAAAMPGASLSRLTEEVTDVQGNASRHRRDRPVPGGLAAAVRDGVRAGARSCPAHGSRDAARLASLPLDGEVPASTAPEARR